MGDRVGFLADHLATIIESGKNVRDSVAQVLKENMQGVFNGQCVCVCVFTAFLGCVLSVSVSVCVLCVSVSVCVCCVCCAVCCAVCAVLCVLCCVCAVLCVCAC